MQSVYIKERERLLSSSGFYRLFCTGIFMFLSSFNLEAMKSIILGGRGSDIYIVVNQIMAERLFNKILAGTELFRKKLCCVGSGEVVLGSETSPLGGVMLLASAIPFVLGRRKGKTARHCE